MRLVVTDYSNAFICLSYLFTDLNFQEHDQNEKYTYFKKNGHGSIQINRLKQVYSYLELSSYALRAGQKSDVFIARYEDAMNILKRMSDLPSK